MPSAQECQESPEECLRAGGRGAPDARRSRRPAGGCRRPAQGSRPSAPPWQPTAPPVPASASSPETKGRQRYCNHRSGAAAAGRRMGEKEPPPLCSRERKLRSVQVLSESVFPATPSPLRGPVAALPSPPFSTPRHSPAQPRAALRGEACPGTASAPPAAPRVTSWSRRESRVVLSSRPGRLGVLGL